MSEYIPLVTFQLFRTPSGETIVVDTFEATLTDESAVLLKNMMARYADGVKVNSFQRREP